MGNILDKPSILDKIKSFYSLKNNSELARFLGVAPNTITNWYGRKTFDIDVLYTKCVDMDFNWLFSNNKEKCDCVLKEDPIPYNSSCDNNIYEVLYNKEREENRKLIEEIGALKEVVRQMGNNRNKSDDESAVVSFTQESLECYIPKSKDPVKPPSSKRSSGGKTL